MDDSRHFFDAMSLSQLEEPEPPELPLPSGAWTYEGNEEITVNLDFVQDMDQTVLPAANSFTLRQGVNTGNSVQVSWIGIRSFRIRLEGFEPVSGGALLDYAGLIGQLKTLAGEAYPAWSNLSIDED